MKVLIACEESQTVCKAFRKRGHEAYSCDPQSPSGGHFGWHFKEDVKYLIDYGWDMVIAFPPCTHLAVSGARWFKQKQADGRQQAAIDFFSNYQEISKVLPKIPMMNITQMASKASAVASRHAEIFFIRLSQAKNQKKDHIPEAKCILGERSVDKYIKATPQLHKSQSYN